MARPVALSLAGLFALITTQPHRAGVARAGGLNNTPPVRSIHRHFHHQSAL
mgnify:CR=1 FL=1